MTVNPSQIADIARGKARSLENRLLDKEAEATLEGIIDGVTVLEALVLEADQRLVHEQNRSHAVQYMTVAEVEDLRKHLGNIEAQRQRNQITVGDHTVYDSNGEPIGYIKFHGEADQFVFEYDYIEGNHG